MLVKLLVTFAIFTIIKSAKILVVASTPSISHQIVFRPLIHELHNHGHEVVVITTDPVYSQGTSPKNLREIDVRNLSYTLWNKILITLGKNNQNVMLSVMTILCREAAKIFQEQLKDKSVQNLIKDKTIKLDLLILEECINPLLIFNHIFKAPVIFMNSFGANPGFMEMVGAATHPLVYPTPCRERIYNLAIWEKISELYNHVVIDHMIKKQQLVDDKMLQNMFGIDTPPLSELKNNVHILFLNIHPIWAHNQPVPHNIFYAWGIHKRPEQILPIDLQFYLDSSNNGFIYVNFGTNVKTSSIASEKLEILLKVFSQLPYNILMKWDMDELPGKSDNIRISKWLPQCDVLRHPNLKLFITQGLQSTYEAINASVPLIGMPMITDQEYNTEMYMLHKIGIKLNLKSLTVEKFENAIKTILTDKSYRKNVIYLRSQMHDRPKPALENAVCWIEYVLRHGGVRHLRAPAANMSWAEYYELELVIIILGVLTVLINVLLLILYSCLRCITCGGIVTCHQDKNATDM